MPCVPRGRVRLRLDLPVRTHGTAVAEGHAHDRSVAVEHVAEAILVLGYSPKFHRPGPFLRYVPSAKHTVVSIRSS